jgi:adenylate kinase
MGIPQVSTGDILRDQIRRGTELGVRVKYYLDQGNLVPDDLILEIVQDRLKQEDCRGGFILDGFPRTVAQAEGLEAILERDGMGLSAVVALESDSETLVRRLGARFTCRDCGADYNAQTGEIPSRCTKCGGPVGPRDDDSAETVRHRLRIFEEQTAPLIRFYEERGRLRRVNGMAPVEDVFRAILSMLG